jgi:hypothetical protein
MSSSVGKLIFRTVAIIGDCAGCLSNANHLVELYILKCIVLYKTTMNFTEKISQLEDSKPSNAILEKKWMSPFECRAKLECPWLHRAIEQKTNIAEVRGLLLMQDWGSLPESLQSAVDYISNGLKHPEKLGNDRTLKNLFASKGWREAIQEGKWLVSNAVWGLRPQKNGKDSEMCGFLGAPIHKQSFLIWGQLVVDLSLEKENFQLVVAGEWATFKNFPGESNSEPLSTYLARWVSWASKWTGKVVVPLKLQRACQAAKGEVFYVRHPSTWHIKSQFENGPLVQVGA